MDGLIFPHCSPPPGYLISFYFILSSKTTISTWFSSFHMLPRGAAVSLGLVIHRSTAVGACGAPRYAPLATRRFRCFPNLLHKLDYFSIAMIVCRIGFRWARLSARFYVNSLSAFAFKCKAQHSLLHFYEHPEHFSCLFILFFRPFNRKNSQTGQSLWLPGCFGQL